MEDGRWKMADGRWRMGGFFQSSISHLPSSIDQLLVDAV
jgi:hypothetical protein